MALSHLYMSKNNGNTATATPASPVTEAAPTPAINPIAELTQAYKSAMGRVQSVLGTRNLGPKDVQIRTAKGKVSGMTVKGSKHDALACASLSIGDAQAIEAMGGLLTALQYMEVSMDQVTIAPKA